MVIIDAARCAGCGLCIQICHEQCMELLEGLVQIDYEVCGTCTQCIAIGSQQALSWDGNQPLPYDGAALPIPSQLDKLLKQRRSMRYYHPDAVQRSLLAEVVY